MGSTYRLDDAKKYVSQVKKATKLNSASKRLTLEDAWANISSQDVKDRSLEDYYQFLLAIEKELKNAKDPVTRPLSTYLQHAINNAKKFKETKKVLAPQRILEEVRVKEESENEADHANLYQSLVQSKKRENEQVNGKINRFFRWFRAPTKNFKFVDDNPQKHVNAFLTSTAFKNLEAYYTKHYANGDTRNHSFLGVDMRVSEKGECIKNTIEKLMNCEDLAGINQVLVDIEDDKTIYNNDPHKTYRSIFAKGQNFTTRFFNLGTTTSKHFDNLRNELNTLAGKVALSQKDL